MWRDSQVHEAEVRVQRGKIRSGRKGDKRSKGEGAAEVLL